MLQYPAHCPIANVHSSRQSTRGPCCSPCKSTFARLCRFDLVLGCHKAGLSSAADNGPAISRLLHNNIKLIICYRVNEDVIIRLKWGQTEYKGRLMSVDSYMNIQLSGTEEFINRKHTGTLGQVLIRYNRHSTQRAQRMSKLTDRTDAITYCGSPPLKGSR